MHLVFFLNFCVDECVCAWCVNVCVCACEYVSLWLFIPSGMICTPYDWLNKGYSFCFVVVVVIVIGSGCGLKINACIPIHTPHTFTTESLHLGCLCTVV